MKERKGGALQVGDESLGSRGGASSGQRREATAQPPGLTAPFDACLRRQKGCVGGGGESERKKRVGTHLGNEKQACSIKKK